MNASLVMSRARAPLARFARRLLTMALLAVPVTVGAAAAEDYPSQPITMIVTFAPGGSADNVARMLVDRVLADSGMQILIEYKPGANGFIGIGAVARAEPDGYTIGFLAGSGLTIAPGFTKDVPFDSRKDFAPIAEVMSYALGLVVRPGLQVETLQDLIELAKASPTPLSYASTGYGSAGHLGGAILQLESGATLKHVPYKGASESVLDVVADRIDFTIAGLLPMAAQIESGGIKLLAVTGQKRIAQYPDVPTVAETYPGFLVDTRFMVLAPAGTPDEIVTKLNQAIVRVLNDPTFRKPLEDQGYEVPTETTPESTAATISRELDRWTALAAKLDISLEAN